MTIIIILPISELDNFVNFSPDSPKIAESKMLIPVVAVTILSLTTAGGEPGGTSVHIPLAMSLGDFRTHVRLILMCTPKDRKSFANLEHFSYIHVSRHVEEI